MSKNQKLLSRKEFKDQVFKRDNHSCVVCSEPAIDAHHILERKLFEDGGYYLDNGVSLCETHHYQAEQTTISCDELRTLAKIIKKVLPQNFEAKNDYDKWGNIILASKQRLKGPMFYDAGTQKILASANLLELFI